MGKHKHLEGEKLAKEVNKEHWDPGVKAPNPVPRGARQYESESRVDI